jgi:hypothetical protein
MRVAALLCAGAGAGALGIRGGHAGEVADRVQPVEILARAAGGSLSLALVALVAVGAGAGG